jgi:hypothetical protein
VSTGIPLLIFSSILGGTGTGGAFRWVVVVVAEHVAVASAAEASLVTRKRKGEEVSLRKKRTKLSVDVAAAALPQNSTNSTDPLLLLPRRKSTSRSSWPRIVHTHSLTLHSRRTMKSPVQDSTHNYYCTTFSKYISKYVKFVSVKLIRI